MLDRVGQQLGNYRLVRLLGSGGFAVVYVAEQIYLNRLAAIKILQTQLGQNDLQIFLSEARTIANFDHPNIIHVLEFGVNQQDNTPYLVMDFAPNGTLRQRHTAGSRIAYDEIIAYTRQIASALQYAHDQNVIHRDVKPENMLIGKRGEILLSDFGIAVTTQSSRYQNRQPDIAGTAAYMAPEQLQGKAAPASDQYALAIAVYEWLCGERPFNGSFTEVMGQQMYTPPPPLRNKVPTISQDVEDVLQTALDKDPQQRFANVQVFAQALENALRHTQQMGSAPNNAPDTNKFANPSPQQSPIGTNSSMQIPLITPPLHQTTNSSLNIPPPQQQYNPPFNAQYPQTNAPSPAPLPVQLPPNSPMQAGKKKRTASKERRVLSTIGILLVLLVGGNILFPYLIASFTPKVHGQPNSTGNSNTKSTPTPSAPSATPSPTPPPAGTVLYQENGSDNWNGWTDMGSDWHPANGKLYNDGSNGSDANFFNCPYVISPRGGTNDYAVEANIQVQSWDTNNFYANFGINVRGNGQGRGFLGLIGINSTAYIQETNDGSEGSYNILRAAPFNLDTNSHTYRVEVKGNDIKLLIDGHLMIDIPDNRFLTAGNVGLLSRGIPLTVTSFKITAL